MEGWAKHTIDNMRDKKDIVFKAVCYLISKVKIFFSNLIFGKKEKKEIKVNGQVIKTGGSENFNDQDYEEG